MSYIERAKILYQQNRHSDAERELRQALASDPDNYEAHLLLVFVYSSLGRKNDALSSAERAVALVPDWSYAWYALSYAHWQVDKKRNTDKAMEAINTALRMEPSHADYHYLKGEILFSVSEWEQALEHANTSLRIDSENLGALNLRARCEVKLNRATDANNTLDWAIRKNPENSTSHANKGWALIEKDQYDEALTHFKEALRLNPNDEWAKEGLKNAIKGKNILYRGILKYFLWMSKLSERNQWIFIIGAYFAYMLVRRLADAYPELAPLTMPLIVLYVLFVFSSWIAIPLSNFFLRFHPLGKFALDKRELQGSSLIGILLVLALLFGIGYLITRLDILSLLAGFFGLMMLPVGGTYNLYRHEKAFKSLGIYTLILAGIGMVGIFIPSAFSLCLILFSVGIFAFGWIVNWVMARA